VHPGSNECITETSVALDKPHHPYAQPRIDKAGNSRSTQRARKLQLSDVDWYAKKSSFVIPAAFLLLSVANPKDQALSAQAEAYSFQLGD
jgi:hypothetical protein